jgi:hypothetical protein
MPKVKLQTRTNLRDHKYTPEPRNLVMEKDTYDYFRRLDRHEEKLFIQHIVGGVER